LKSPPPQSGFPAHRLIPYALVALTFLVFGQTVRHRFVNLDDLPLILENPQVLKGLTLEGVAWAMLATSGASFWHPLTWLSMMTDVSLFGLNPAGHHLMSVVIHAVNAVLLFRVLQRMTGATGRSALVAALFAIHPLHVESVAWAAERKDVLSTLFFLLSWMAYVGHSRQPGIGRYLAVLAFFALSLMAKPMMVTFPFALLLFDRWPLDRFGRVSASRLLLEKVPLLALSVAASLVTLSYEGDAAWLHSADVYPLWARVANAFVSYATYLRQAVLPYSLAVFYPHPGTGISLPQVAISALLVAGLCAAAFRLRDRYPYGFAGLAFFFGTLVPVIGLVQVSDQAMADRFTYVPLIGVFIAAAWGCGDLAERLHVPVKARIALSLAVVAAFSVLAWIQTGYWKDSGTLYEHTLKVQGPLKFIHNNYGVFLKNEGRLDEAAFQYREALRIKPTDLAANANLAVVLDLQGKTEEAVALYRDVLRRDPTSAKAARNLAVILARSGKAGEAIPLYEKALQLQPNSPDAHVELAKLFMQGNQPENAIVHFREALAQRRDYPEAHYGLGLALARIDALDEAIRHLREALRLHPDYPETYNNLGAILARRGNVAEAIPLFREALRLNPAYEGARRNLDMALAATR
jgi:tetratricopeptide (TPR) repeat protein